MFSFMFILLLVHWLVQNSQGPRGKQVEDKVEPRTYMHRLDLRNIAVQLTLVKFLE